MSTSLLYHCFGIRATITFVVFSSMAGRSSRSDSNARTCDALRVIRVMSSCEAHSAGYFEHDR